MVEFLDPDWPAPARVRTLVTTRNFGNLATHVGDAADTVAQRRQRLDELLPSSPRWLEQVHGNRCIDAGSMDGPAVADAAFARHPGQVCAVLTADCLPILLCDDAGTVVAAAHAGWRGLAAGIVEATVATLAVPPDRLLAWLGPAIGPQAFEVGADVHAAFVGDDAGAETAFRAGAAGKWHCDLYALARRRLARLGVVRVSGGHYCTHADGERFFSYRRERNTGRMACLIWIV